MNKHSFMHFKDTELGGLALKLSSDRRILLDFVRTCASGERTNNGYLHSRDSIRDKALKILEELEED